MANELKHKTVGTTLTQAEWEAVDGHALDGQAAGDIIYAADGTILRRLAVGSSGQYLGVSSGLPSWKSLSLANNQALLARNQGDTADLDVIKLNAADVAEVTQSLAVSNSNGIDLGSGVAIDQDLLTVNEGSVDAARPRCSWDESRDRFKANKGIARSGQEELESTLDDVEGNVIRAVFAKSGIADNTATGIFSVTTPTPAELKNGGYACFVRALIGHNLMTNSASNSAAKGYSGMFARAVAGGPSPFGSASAVMEVAETAVSATNVTERGIDAVTMTVAETSETVMTVRFTVDTSGTLATTAQVVVYVELVYRGFDSPPTLAAV